MSGTNPLEMSDEEFLNLTHPPAHGSDDGAAVTTSETQEQGTEGAASETDGAATPSTDAGAEGDGSGTEPNTPTPEGNVDGTASAGDAAPTPDGTVAAAGADTPAPGTVEADGATTPEVTPEQAQTFYAEIMAPFKANGKMIQLRSPEEAKSLMQMGANYTRKMQEIAPYRKTLIMLQNNGLLDAEKLSFYIDLDKGDPEAVKKFIKDRGIDPLDIDTSTDPAYLGGSHQVSDEEVAFRTALDELSSTPEGQATLADVNGRWDSASKELLWKNPELLSVIQEQRESGVYDAIAAEIDRQRTLGKLANVTFLEAYKLVGDELVAQHSSGQAPANPAPAQTQPQVLATRPAAPKAPIANSDQVAAAAPSRGTAPTQKTFVNPLAMSDDEFLKQMENRV